MKLYMVPIGYPSLAPDSRDGVVAGVKGAGNGKSPRTQDLKKGGANEENTNTVYS